MTVRRVMGIETEYGLTCPAQPHTPQVELAARVVAAYGGACRALGHTEDVRWDFGGETPLHDARGFVHDRDAADPSMLTDDPEAPAPPGPRTLADGRAAERVASLTELEREWYRGSSRVLRNGARLYVDHAHPEYSAPEAMGPREAVRYDRAGDAVMVRAMAALAGSGSPEIVIYKNNVDGKGASYGCHENYLVERAVPWDDLVTALVPFLVTRPVVCGAGRVGLGPTSAEPGYQISQRADYVEQVAGPRTTYDRPIVNTRDEPHADPRRWRRLHVIGGDANCAPASTLLKLGATALVLWVLEHRGLPSEWTALALADPVADCRTVSRDLALSAPLAVADGRRLTALEIQRVYLDTVRRELQGAPDPDTADILRRWETALDLLARGHQHAVGHVEWATKLALLEARRTRDGLGWGSPELAAMDLQWGDLRPGRSLAGRMLAAGHLEQLVSQQEIAAAEFTPPADTRAYFRGEMIRRFQGKVYAASWHSLVLEPEPDRLVRLPMTNPFGGSRTRTGELLDAAPDLDTIIAALTGEANEGEQ